MKPVIYFAHGNGFPSLVYRKLLDHFKNNYDVFAIEKIGHDDDYPITDNWIYLVDELISDIERQTDKPVIAVGHSMGGVLCYMASVKRPDLFRGIIALDSFFVGKLKLKLLYWAKKIGWIEKLTPAGRTKNRRNYWKSKAEIKTYLQSKAFFKRFDPDCLNDYIKHGTKQDKEGYYLEFNREREYLIYCTLPDAFHLFEHKKNRLKIPTIMIYGEQSEMLSAMDIRAAQKLYHMQCYSTPGSHMFPLEYPIECAKKIHGIIKENFS